MNLVQKCRVSTGAISLQRRGYAKLLAKDVIIPFGAYEGQPVRNVPSEYLGWLATRFNHLLHNAKYWRAVAKEVLAERHFGISGARHELVVKDFTDGRIGDALLKLDHRAKLVDKPQGYAFLLRECGKNGNLEEAIRIHDHLMFRGFAKSPFLGDILVEMYGNLGCLERARTVFAKMKPKNVVSWTAMMNACAVNGHPDEALRLYEKMDMPPDAAAYVCVLGCCGALGALEGGKIVHRRLRGSEVRIDDELRIALFEMYAKCGAADIASNLFWNLNKKKLGQWNLIIWCLACKGWGHMAIEAYERMTVKPNAETFVNVLNACCKVDHVKSIESDIIAAGFESDELLRKSIADAYSRINQEHDMRL